MLQKRQHKIINNQKIYKSNSPDMNTQRSNERKNNFSFSDSIIKKSSNTATITKNTTNNINIAVTDYKYNAQEILWRTKFKFRTFV